MTLLIVFLPLLGALLAGLFGRYLGRRGSQALTCLLMLVSAALTIPILHKVGFVTGPFTVPIAEWIGVGSFHCTWALWVDTLTAVMLFTVAVISALVHVYSIGYMRDDPSIPRFMSYLSLFTFFMMMLVSADNLVQMVFGWEGVGLSSYLLIGFWSDRPSANAAAIKAFVVTRIGDVGFILGIAGIYLAFDTVKLDAIFAAAPALAGNSLHIFGLDLPLIAILCLLLFLGAMGKSAQIGFHVWLPDAMEGPTPVSALIHAATMVTAGVFMVARMSPLFALSPAAMAVVAAVGATTALFAAVVGCVQTDIKRVIAYSTCSQLGYMFCALGVGAWSAAIFHLMTHAFFKALLFLGAGSVIHAMSGEQDMRRMGGLATHIKATYLMMWIGSLSLAGLPIFSGYFSKDVILEADWGAKTGVGLYAFWMGAVATVLTGFYSWRLLCLTFHGRFRSDEKTLAHVHESPLSMLIPLGVLSIGALLAGLLGAHAFIGGGRVRFWQKALSTLGPDALVLAHHAPNAIKVLPVVLALAGIGLALALYVLRPDLPERIAARFPGTYRLLLHKGYFDEIYECIFVKPLFALGRFLRQKCDLGLIDRFGPDGMARVTVMAAHRASRLQSGYVFHYAFAMIAGLVVFVTVFVLGWEG